MGAWSNLPSNKITLCSLCLLISGLLLGALLLTGIYQSDDPQSISHKTLDFLLRRQDSDFPPPVDVESLRESLSRVSFRNKTVIITTLNKSWAENNTMIDAFLYSFRIGEQISELLEHLLIVNLDQASHDRCMKLHKHCFKLITPGIDFSGEKFFMTGDYLKMMWRRVDFLRLVLELGYNFVFTDADIMWLRDPFPHFSRDSDMDIACDRFNGNQFDLRNYPNGGFVHAVSNNKTVALYKMWYKARLGHPKHHDQDVFNDIKFSKEFTGLGLRVRFLDTRYFGGFCQVVSDFDRVCTMHANCCTKLERKLVDLELVLEDWKVYRGKSVEERREQRMFWRAPRECLKSFH